MERRERDRYRIWLPVKLFSEGLERLAVTYDVSDAGMLMLAAEALNVGARVTATLDLPSEPPVTRVAEGHVVRAGKNEDDPHGLWPHRVAIAFDLPMQQFQAEIEAIARDNPPLFAKG